MRSVLPTFVDRVSVGPLAVCPYWLGMADDPGAVLAAFDRGLDTFFVTADMHWPLYDGLRRGLAQLLARGGGIRDRITVAGVSYATQPEFCTVPFRELVDAVPGLDRLDLLIAGGAYGYEGDRRLEVYRRHRATGYLGARAIGSTFHDRDAAVAHCRDGTLDACLVRFNSAHTGARDDVFPHVGTRRAPLFGFKSTLGWLPPATYAKLGLDPEHWQPAITDHYRFVLSHAELDGILCALSHPREVDALAAAIDEGPLDDGEQDHLILLSRLAGGSAELVE